MLLLRFSCSFNSFRAWLSDHYQPDRLVHMCKIDTFDPDRNNRHKQNQELGWSSCIMNIFRKLFKFRAFRVKLEKSMTKLLTSTSACSAVQGFVRLSTDFFLGALLYAAASEVCWCVSNLMKNLFIKVRKEICDGDDEIFAELKDAFRKTILKFRNQRIVFCLSWKSFSEMFLLLLHNSLESRIYWLFSVAWKCLRRKLFSCFLLRNVW